MLNKWLLALLVLMSIALLFLSKKNTPAPKNGTDIVNLNKIVALPQNAPIAKVADTDEMRIANLQKTQLGISSYSFPVDQNKIKMSVRLKVRRLWCRGGEIDAMIRTAQVSKSPEFLLSVEQIGSSSAAIASRALSISELQKNQTLDFAVTNPSSGALLLGIFVCKDGLKSGVCHNKSLIDYNKDGADKRSNLRANDYLFLAHKVLVRPNGGVDLFSAYIEEKTAKLADEYAKKKLGSNAKDLEGVAKYDRILRSEPLQFADNALELILTQGDFSCMKNEVNFNNKIFKK
ncbi:MAG: hypothetical protein NTX25_24210 [Proteobacteria bacterium]|nr:hypothetical protein [Pseudomonadota bacterium]